MLAGLEGCHGIQKMPQVIICILWRAQFGMSAIMNGIALHGGFIPYGYNLLDFMEYACAVAYERVSKQRIIYVFTHDSMVSGEDGWLPPTY